MVERCCSAAKGTNRSLPLYMSDICRLLRRHIQLREGSGSLERPRFQNARHGCANPINLGVGEGSETVKHRANGIRFSTEAHVEVDVV